MATTTVAVGTMRVAQVSKPGAGFQILEREIPGLGAEHPAPVREGIVLEAPVAVHDLQLGQYDASNLFFRRADTYFHQHVLPFYLAGSSDMEPMSPPAFDTKHAVRFQPATPPIRNP
jgi:hypothetical protein